MGRVGSGLALTLALAGGGSAGAAPAPPQRVMSLNVCADQLLLMLLPPQRIASVTWLARDPEGSQMAAAAARVPVNHGAAEEVVRAHPDLVIAGSYTTPATRALLQKLHFPMLIVGSADSFAEVRTMTRAIAAAVGEQARAEALLAGMSARLAELGADHAPPLRIAAWDGAGFSARKGSMYDAILTAAGARNVAADAGTGAPEVEALLARAPQLLVAGQPGFEKPGRRSDVAHHPIVRRFWADRTVIVPQSAYACGTPLSADAALLLRDQMRARLARARAPLPFAASVGR